MSELCAKVCEFECMIEANKWAPPNMVDSSEDDSIYQWRAKEKFLSVWVDQSGFIAHFCDLSTNPITVRSEDSDSPSFVEFLNETFSTMDVNSVVGSNWDVVETLLREPTSMQYSPQRAEAFEPCLLIEAATVGDHLAVQDGSDAEWRHAIYVGRSEAGEHMIVDSLERRYVDFMRCVCKCAIIRYGDTMVHRVASARVAQVTAHAELPEHLRGVSSEGFATWCRVGRILDDVGKMLLAPSDVKHRTLCLSSGGGCGYVHVGFIKELQARQMLSDIDTIVGCSIGAVVGFCWMLGLSVEEMQSVLFELNDESVISLKGLAMFLEQYGIDDGEYLTAFFIDILLGKGLNPQLTLSELHDLTGKRLLAVSFNISDGCVVTFGPSSHPDMRVVDALRATTAIPIGFAPFEWGSKLFIDGAVRNPYPLHIANSDAEARGVPFECVIGCNIVCKEGFAGAVGSLWEYLQRVVCVCTLSSGVSSDRQSFVHTVSKVSTLDFCQSERELKAMVVRAARRTADILEERRWGN